MRHVDRQMGASDRATMPAYSSVRRITASEEDH